MVCRASGSEGLLVMCSVRSEQDSCRLCSELSDLPAGGSIRGICRLLAALDSPLVGFYQAFRG